MPHRSSSHHKIVKHSISKEEIQELPLVVYEGKIELIQSITDLKGAIKHLKKEEILGFDTESRPSFKRGVTYPISLIQLAASDRVFLFQLNKIEEVEHFVPLWTTAKILKVGAALRDDVKKLKDFHNFKEEGFFDISVLTHKFNIKNTGLRSLAGLLFGKRISKSSQVTNWASEELSKSQILYAATDAWMSREIYLHLQSLIDTDTLL